MLPWKYDYYSTLLSSVEVIDQFHVIQPTKKTNQQPTPSLVLNTAISVVAVVKEDSATASSQRKEVL